MIDVMRLVFRKSYLSILKWNILVGLKKKLEFEEKMKLLKKVLKS